jgi:hypothetical protein
MVPGDQHHRQQVTAYRQEQKGIVRDRHQQDTERTKLQKKGK